MKQVLWVNLETAWLMTDSMIGVTEGSPTPIRMKKGIGSTDNDSRVVFWRLPSWALTQNMGNSL